MRTEIAVLKLVRHENVIEMRDVFETRDVRGAAAAPLPPPPSP